MRDFTYQMYNNLCSAILRRHRTVTVAEYLENLPRNTAIIRHDVDKKPHNALVMAYIEKSLGIRSTYYFRTVPDSFDLSIIKEIHQLGHEIGFHYEVLDKSKGDANKAIEIFEKELKLFPFDVQTICMHGNPLTPWVNKDLWKDFDFKKYGITGEAYLSIPFSDLHYFSDTGRSWNGRYSVKDLSDIPDAEIEKISNTEKLMEFIRKNQGNYYIVTHPQRWNDALIPWATELLCQTVKNMGKSGIKYIRKKQ